MNLAREYTFGKIRFGVTKHEIVDSRLGEHDVFIAEDCRLNHSI